MNPVTFTTPTGSTVTLSGNRPHFTIKCNFHATKEKSFMMALEKTFFVCSIAFREQYSVIKFNAKHLATPSDVTDKLKTIVETHLI